MKWVAVSDLARAKPASEADLRAFSEELVMSGLVQKLVWAVLDDAGKVVRVVEVPFEAAPVKVGRIGSAQLLLDDPGVSRVHAVVERGASGEPVLVDLGSAGGTFVGEAAVTRRTLCDGDVVRFGRVSARVSFGAVDVSEAVEEGVGAEEGEGEGEMRAPVGGVERANAWELAGYYDAHGNYIPGYYDDLGQYRLGYGYHDAAGAWVVAMGYYDPRGEWVEAELYSTLDEDGGVCAGVVEEGAATVAGDRELYTSMFFERSAGELLEVALLWGDHVLSVVQYDAGRERVTVGSGAGADVVVEHALIARLGEHALLVRQAGGWVLRWCSGMDGVLRVGSQAWTLAELERQPGVACVDGIFAASFQARSSARIELGEVTLLARFGERVSLAPGLAGARVDMQPARFLVGSAFAHLMFLALALTMPERSEALELDGLTLQDRFVQLNVTPNQEIEDEKDSLKPEEGGAQAPAEESAAHKGPEGAAGDASAASDEGRMSLDGSDRLELAQRRERDRRVALDAGALAVLGGDQIGAVLGGAQESLGAETTRTLGQLDGLEPGDAIGARGLGIRGTGRGGPGDGDRSIGMSDDVVGDSIGRKPTRGVREAEIGERTTRVPEPVVVPGELKTTGCISREAVQRVVRQKRNEVRACYEARLQSGLRESGQVKVAFKINAAGGVFLAKVEGATLKDNAVQECMLRKIRHWRFSPLTGCAMVDVKYPFNFSY